MSCPYFQPDAPAKSDSWARPPRLPLGEAYAGVCRAEAEPFIPEGEVLFASCNRGYCRQTCSRFPPSGECDAMRYTLAEDRGREIELQYVFEKDYSPVKHGRAIYDSEARTVYGLEGVAAAQALAFAESYLRRRGNLAVAG